MKNFLFVGLGAFLGCATIKETPNLEPIQVTEQPGASLAQPISTPTAPAVPGCGNGVREILMDGEYPAKKPEECDSTNKGCDQKFCVLNQCGDGVLDADESCDDGNISSKDGCSNRCEIELNAPDNTFELADKARFNVTKESVFLGTLREGEKWEIDHVSFTVSSPMELSILDHGFYDCGLSQTKTVLYDKDKKELWSKHEFPSTRTVTVQPGTYYLVLSFETQDYMLWFKPTNKI